MQKFQKNYQKNKKFNKQYFNHKKNKYPYFYKKKNRNKKIKTGIFFKEPTFKTILYPFYLNLKLINEYLKKK
ncbi:TPA: hypothetical protein N0F65_000362 (mitochondrion) [Lagenidium giganteum]|uniref:Ribosomal protein S18 n=1 Tax=Lagenidium giganteum TaxID=4803 RepID=A0AAV2YI24_9STRA|nr:TPA: hypothetical protein N0F65_000362 [Lagenidium giganteum]